MFSSLKIGLLDHVPFWTHIDPHSGPKCTQISFLRFFTRGHCCGALVPTQVPSRLVSTFDYPFFFRGELLTATLPRSAAAPIRDRSSPLPECVHPGRSKPALCLSCHDIDARCFFCIFNVPVPPPAPVLPPPHFLNCSAGLFARRLLSDPLDEVPFRLYFSCPVTIGKRSAPFC